MSATPADVQSKIAAGEADILAMTSSPASMKSKYGDPSKWPTGTMGYKGFALLAAASAEAGQLVAPSSPAPTPTPPPASTPVPVGALIFGDEFDGPAGALPDSNLWTLRTGKAGNGLAYWDATRSKLDGNGNLVVTAQLLSGTWRTGMIMGKKVITGPRYIEARAKLPEIAGNWSAPTWEWDPFGKGLEVDVNEQLGDQPGEYHFTLHNWDAGKQFGKPISTSGANLADWQTYGCAVYADRADAYFNGKLMASIKASDIGYSDLTSHQVCENIDLNIGGWGGPVSGSGPFEMLVDYLHVYTLA